MCEVTAAGAVRSAPSRRVPITRQQRTRARPIAGRVALAAVTNPPPIDGALAGSSGELEAAPGAALRAAPARPRAAGRRHTLGDALVLLRRRAAAAAAAAAAPRPPPPRRVRRRRAVHLLSRGEDTRRGEARSRNCARQRLQAGRQLAVPDCVTASGRRAAAADVHKPSGLGRDRISPLRPHSSTLW